MNYNTIIKDNFNIEQWTSRFTQQDRTLDVKTYAKALKDADLEIKNTFQHGADINTLVQTRSTVVDSLLTTAWQAHGLTDRLALIAVGGYGRGELHPGSDIDLLLLLDDEIEEDLAQRLGAFVAFIWDIGFPVGHSVRTIDDCVEQAQNDITVITSLMESRLIRGNQALFLALRERISPDRIWPSTTFFTAKLKEQSDRYRKYGHTAYKLEPNLKEGPGGLRDIQMIGWIGKRHLNLHDLGELVTHGFLNKDECHALISGRTFLWRVRFALHSLAKRDENRLLFAYQIELAKLFGFQDQDQNLAVEQFMQQYYRTVMELERLNEMLLQHYQEEIPYQGIQVEAKPINRRFQAVRGYLEVTAPDVFSCAPSALLEIFLILQQYPELKGVRASTIRLIRKSRDLINDSFRQNIANRGLFMEILRQPAGITHEFRRMNRYGILAAYWPDFAQITGRMQFDLFHVYTVDEHTLRVLRNIRRFSVDEHAHELPFCSGLIKHIPKLEILYLAALFHDIAKGRKGDHSELGAEYAYTFCLNHNMSPYDADLVAWLVRQHLTLSVTAQRRDISDPDVINAFAVTVGSINRLNHLYLLTVSDIRATNPNLWNNWKGSLLQELYNATHRALRRGPHNPLVREEMGAEVKTSALELLEEEKITPEQSQQIWRNFRSDYFLRHSADEIAWHTKAILSATHKDESLVLVRQVTARGATEIFIYTQNHEHIFARISATLTTLGLNILDARIISSNDGYTLDTFLVLDQAGEPITEVEQVEQIEQSLLKMLKNPESPAVKINRLISQRNKNFNIPTEIIFETPPDCNLTLLELITADHPGLLSAVGRAFIESQVLVCNARITTLGTRAKDIFYITNLLKQPINDPKHQDKIRNRIMEQLNELSG